MRKSRLHPKKQSRLIEFLVAGSSARAAAPLAGVNTKTAVLYFHRLRQIIEMSSEEDSRARSKSTKATSAASAKASAGAVPLEKRPFSAS